MLLLIVALNNSIGQLTTESYLINSTDGLSNNKINDIFQDSKGYLWFGTDDGLNRYDGYGYVVYRQDIYNTSSIASSQIFSIDEDHKGNIWVGTNKGISKWDVLTNQFANIAFYSHDFDYYENRTLDIFVVGDTAVWCLLEDKVVMYNPENDAFLEYAFTFNNEIESRIRFNTFHYDQIHNMLLLGSNQGLKILDIVSGEIQSTSLSSVEINDIFQERNGTIWLGSEIGISKCIWPDSTLFPNNCEQVLSGIEITGIEQIEGNRLVLVLKHRTVLMDQYTGELINGKYIQLNELDNFSSTSSILLDKSRNLWIGTSEGVYMVDLKPAQFSFFNITSPDFPLDNDMISSVFLSESLLYLGSWGGGFQVLDLNTGNKSFYSKINERNVYPEGGVNVIFLDKKERLWVLSEGMYQYIENDESFIPVKEILSIPRIEEIRGSRIYDIIEPVNGLFIIGHSSGIYIIDENKGLFDNLNYIEADSIYIPLHDVSSVEYSTGYLWFGTSYGLVRYSLNNDEHSFYPVDRGFGLVDRILTLKVDSQERLWVGTPSGLFKFNEIGNYFQGFSVKNGFANDYIYAIEEDRNGILWMSTNKGIVSLDPTTNTIRNFGVQHGLSCMEFNLNASYFSNKGIMFFGGIHGVNYFNPDSVINQKDIANTEISGYKHFSHEANYFLPTLPQQLSFKDNESVQLFFSLLDFGDQEYKTFKYRLKGPKENGRWHNIGTQNSVILSGLDHGKYSFEVLGSDRDGQWSSTAAGIEVKVIAPIYRRRIFISIMLLPLLFLSFVLFEFRTKTLRKSNRALREKEIVAKEVLKQKDLISSRNKNIEDSLKYAQRIQYAMFTNESEIKKMFPESFIIQKPKDIVSGDFFWAKKIGSKIFLAVADCTGHGVPGAFMSLIGLEFFRQIIENQGVHTPSLILKEINKNFDLIFDNMAELDLRDGMDLAFCVIDTKTNMLEFSGAFNPLYILRKGELIEIKGDKNILGPDLGFGRNPFTNHKIRIYQDDVLYLFSDGYADQFGGPEGKKFKQRRFRHLLLSVFNQAMNVQKEILENSIIDWQGENEQVDDILVVGVRPFFLD